MRCAAAEAAEAGGSGNKILLANQEQPLARASPTDAVKHRLQRFSAANYILFFLCVLL
jgi:hypothetical protein